MSTRHKHKSRAPSGALQRLLFARQDSVRDWQSWREIHPILLRSTGLVGLAVAVVAVVSDQSFVSEPHAQTQPEIVVAGVRPQSVDAALESTAAETPAPAATSSIIRVRSADAAAPSLAPQDGAPRETTVALPEAARSGTEMAALTPVAEPAVSAAAVDALTEPEPMAVAARMPAPDRFAVETPEPPRKASLWPEAATECPRDWVAVETGTTGDSAARCESAPIIDEASGSTGDAALQDALSDRAVEVAGLQVAPRLPQARPERAPTKVKAKKRSRRGGKLGPPPNCGKKYARWRYVNKVPTWYCK